MSKSRGIDIPWPALAICGAFGVVGLLLRMWWGAAFFLGMPALLLALDQAVRRGWLMHPDEREAIRRQRSRPKSVRRAVPEPEPVPWAGPIPELDEAGQAQVRSLAAALVDAGLFAPEVPDPALAFAHIADGGVDEITLEEVLHALIDPREWFPEADPARWSANIVLHATQVEQLPEYLVEQVHDLARISHGALRVEQVSATIEGQGRTAPVTMRLLLNGEAQEWRWHGHAKYLSTVLHCRMAEALAAAGSTRQLAFFFLDQGFIFACLAPDALDGLEGLPSWGHGWVAPDFAHEAGSING